MSKSLFPCLVESTHFGSAFFLSSFLKYIFFDGEFFMSLDFLVMDFLSGLIFMKSRSI